MIWKDTKGVIAKQIAIILLYTIINISNDNIKYINNDQINKLMNTKLIRTPMRWRMSNNKLIRSYLMVVMMPSVLVVVMSAMFVMAMWGMFMMMMSVMVMSSSSAMFFMSVMAMVMAWSLLYESYN